MASPDSSQSTTMSNEDKNRNNTAVNPRKRSKADCEAEEEGADTNTSIYHQQQQNPDYLESLLSVPLPIIFRQVRGSQKPLLSRAEAKCFLQITMLAQEFDVLTSHSAEALHRRLWCRKFAQDIIQADNPFLRSLLPLLSIQGNMITTSAIHGMDDELYRVLTALEQCGVALKQFSEQNWTLSESLLETLGDVYDEESTKEEYDLPKGAILAREKRRLSDLQEELCHRIENLLASAFQNTMDGQLQDDEDEEMEQENSQDSQSSRKGKDGALDSTTPLEQWCAQLWSVEEAKSNNIHLNFGKAVSAKEQQQEKRISERGDKDTAENRQHATKNTDKNRSKVSMDYEEEEEFGHGEQNLFSYPETLHGLDQKNQDTQHVAVDALQALQQQKKQESTKKPANNDESQESTRSIVSNHSTDNQDDDDKNAIPTVVTAAPSANKNNANRYTESQVQRRDASEALAALAGFE